ncbi:serine/threonine protein phosphatase [bacterium]|nr:serine/threonine protein phosphatase [bacterium]
MRLFAWSDLHVDYPANLRTLEQLSCADFRDDALLIAGDVSSDANRLMRALEGLKNRFAEVAFVPGNHDLWVSPQTRESSLEKLHALRAACRVCEIKVDPFRIRLTEQTVDVVPLLSWYLKPEEGDGSLYLPKPGEDASLAMWADNRRIKWPHFEPAETPADHLLNLNHLDPYDDSECVVTFSHFLPRVELAFNDWERFIRGEYAGTKDPHPEFNFTRVAGCRQLDERARRLGSRVHVYGHQHRNRDRFIDGVRYVSHCLGYPAERTTFDSGMSSEQPIEIKLNVGLESPV